MSFPTPGHRETYRCSSASAHWLRTTEGKIGTTELPSLIDMPEADIARGVRALDGEYLTIHWRSVAATPIGEIVGITSAARRLVGMWPSAESVTDRLLATLDPV